MGCDLRNMVIVHIDGEESVRSIDSFMVSRRYGSVPIPVLDVDEVYFIDESGISHIIDVSDMYPYHGWC